MQKYLVGKIRKVEKHPNADKLNVVTVLVGGEERVIVCGAPNIKPGMKGELVPVVLPGSKIKVAANKERTDFTECEVKEIDIRGIKSFGMLCSQKELGEGAEDSGIWILDPKKMVPQKKD